MLSFELAILAVGSSLGQHRAQWDSASQWGTPQPVQSCGVTGQAYLVPWGRLFKASLGNSTLCSSSQCRQPLRIQACVAECPAWLQILWRCSLDVSSWDVLLTQPSFACEIWGDHITWFILHLLTYNPAWLYINQLILATLKLKRK